MKRTYITKSLRDATLGIIIEANRIIEEYLAQGFILTLRQLYYQFVARGLIPNTQQEYKRLGSIVADARLCGLMDWNAIEDRTRNLRGLPSWDNPAEIIESCASQYIGMITPYSTYYVEVWIEKEALAGVFQSICNKWRVPFFSCKGYTSLSEMHSAAMRLRVKDDGGKIPTILHFGDHDPSGIDMTRDIIDRLDTFECPLEVSRLALNMEQVEEFDPPPNPAKITDSRYAGYVVEFGEESWELDALEPSILAGLVEGTVQQLIDRDTWDEAMEREQTGREQLRELSGRFDELFPEE